VEIRVSEPVVRVHSSPKRPLAVKAARSTGATQMTVPRTAADVLDDHVTFDPRVETST